MVIGKKNNAVIVKHEMSSGQFATESQENFRGCYAVAFCGELGREAGEAGKEVLLSWGCDSGTVAARTSPARNETYKVGAMGTSACGPENVCLFRSQLPSLSSVPLPHRCAGLVSSDLLTFVEAQDIHFNGKFPDFYSLRLSRLNLILSANSG